MRSSLELTPLPSSQETSVENSQLLDFALFLVVLLLRLLYIGSHFVTVIVGVCSHTNTNERLTRELERDSVFCTEEFATDFSCEFGSRAVRGSYSSVLGFA
jgi:hypothetical protein